jgi:hypothetical protein
LPCGIVGASVPTAILTPASAAAYVSGIDVPVDGGLVAAVRTGPRPGESPARD